jgi:hypothetical protein
MALSEIEREEMRRRMHRPIPEQGEWLRQIRTAVLDDFPLDKRPSMKVDPRKLRVSSLPDPCCSRLTAELDQASLLRMERQRKLLRARANILALPGKVTL